MRELSEKEILDHVESENGYSIIENAIEQDYIKEILQELERLEAVRPGGELYLAYLREENRINLFKEFPSIKRGF